MRKGFTLIELLVVIAIISVLSGLVMAGVFAGLRRADQLQDLNNLRGIGQAAVLYAQNHRFFPHYGDGSNGIAGENDAEGSLLSLSLLVRERLIDNPALFVPDASNMIAAESPDWENKEELAEFTLEPYNCAYGWSKRARKPGGRSDLPLASTAYIEFESDADIEGDGTDASQCFPDGINVLYLDGRVAWCSLTNEDALLRVVERVVVSEGLESYTDR